MLVLKGLEHMYFLCNLFWKTILTIFLCFFSFLFFKRGREENIILQNGQGLGFFYLTFFTLEVDSFCHKEYE